MVHAELFAELDRRANQMGCYPMRHEIPYVTHCPVVLPKRRDLATDGAVKWVDLCLHSEDHSEWLWFEFKVRHTGHPDRRGAADRSAQDGVRKDIAALTGFDLALTRDAWEHPDGATKSHWMDAELKPHAASLSGARHHFVMAYLQLDSPALDPNVWSSETLVGEVGKWLPKRSVRTSMPKMEIDITSGIGERHSLAVARWSTAPPLSAQAFCSGLT